MATRGRFGKTLSGQYSPGATWAGSTYGVSATQLIRQANAANISTAAATTGGATGATGARMSETARIADNLDVQQPLIEYIMDPTSLNEGNRMSVAGVVGAGQDPRTARNPIALLMKEGDRKPTEFELANQWAYDPNREPMIGPGKYATEWNEYLQAGILPPAGSKARQDLIANLGTDNPDQLAQLGATTFWGTPLEERTGLQKGPTNVASQYSYNPPAYKIVQNPDGTTRVETSGLGWDGKPAGWYPSEVATSPSNFPATGAGGVPDDPNFKWTPNPTTWWTPTGEVASIPGSGNITGFNPEIGKWMTRPNEVGQNTTWELAATNPWTGQIDPEMITREVAIKLNEFGNLPTEYQYLMTEAKPWGYWSGQTPTTTTTPRGETPGGGTPPKDTTPKDTTPKDTTPKATPIGQRPGPTFRVGTTTPSAPAVKPQQPISIPKMTAL